MTSRNTKPALWGRNLTKKQRSRARGRRLLVEGLEDRRVLATTWYVDAAFAGTELGTNAQPFNTIQEGVNAAAPIGDTVHVAAGTYEEHVTVNKSMLVLGAKATVDGRDPTRTGLPATESVVRGNTSGSYRTSSFTIDADDVVIDGFTIQDQTSANQFGAALYVKPGRSGTEVRNNIIQNNAVGLFISNSSSSNQAVIEKNLFRNNNVSPGTASNGHDIYADQYTAGVGIQNVLIDSNKFTNSALVIDSWALGLSNTHGTPFTNVTFSHNEISNHGRGVYLYNTDNSAVTANSILGVSNYAIGLFDGDDAVSVSQNRVENGTRGIWFGADFGHPNTNTTVNQNAFLGNSLLNVLFDAGSYTGTLDASANYWGTSDPLIVDATIDDTPVSTVDFTPLLANNESIPNQAIVGFQPDSSSVIVHGTGGQTAGGRAAEGVSLVADPGTVHVLAGSYSEPISTAGKAIALAAGASPGQVTATGLALDAADTLPIDINGTAAGTGYDQWVVNGTVTLGNATLTVNVTPAPTGGEEYIIVANDGSDAVTGTFSGLAEGAAISSNFGGSGKTARITYQGGDGNDVAILVDGPGAATPPADSSPSEFELRVAGDYVELWDVTGPDPDVLVYRRLLNGLSGITVTGEDGFDDTFTVDVGSLPSSGFTVSVVGGSGDESDTLELVDVPTTFTTHTYNYTNAHDGSIQLTGTGVDFTVNYTGLEPLTNDGTAETVIFNLPGSADSTILLAHLSGTQARLSSSLATFETTDFDYPVDDISTLALPSLTINLGASDQTIDIRPLTFNPDTSLTINGNAGTGDQVNFTTGALAVTDELTIATVETIEVDVSITADGGITFTAPSITYLAGSLQTDGTDISITGGAVVVDAATVTLDTDVTTGVGGQVDLGGTITYSTSVNQVLSIVTEAFGGGGSVILGTLSAGAGVYLDELQIDVTGGSGNVSIAGSLQTATGVLISGADQIDLANVESGNIDVTGTNIDLNGTTYTAATDDVTFTGKVDLEAGGAITVTSGGGVGDNITFTSTVDGNQSLALVAASGAVDMQGNVGATTALNLFTVTSAAQVDLANVRANNVAVTGSNIDLNGTMYTALTDDVTFTGVVDLEAGGAITVTSGSGAGDNITFASTIDDTGSDDTLSLTAGTGSITATGAVGSVSALASILVNSAVDVTFSTTVRTTGNVTQSAGTGTTTFHGTSGTGIGGNLGITTNAIALSSAVVMTAGTVTLNAQNAISVNASAGLNAGASTITIAANQDGAAAQGFAQADGTTIQTTNATTTPGSALSITVGGGGGAAIAALQTGAAGRVSITVGGAITDNNGGTTNISAGSAGLTAVSGIGAGESLEITRPGGQFDLAFQNTSSGNVEIYNTGGLTIANLGGSLATSYSAGGATITAGSPHTFATNTSTVLTATYTTLDNGGVGADNITVNGGVIVEVTGASQDLIFQSGDQIVINATATARANGTGGDVVLESGYNDTDNDGSMTLDGAILATNRITLDLNAETGAATQSAGSITAANLQLLSTAAGGGAFDLTAGTNDVDTIAASSTGAVSFTDTDGLTVGSVTGAVTTDGIITTSDDVNLCAGSLTLTHDIAAVAGTVRLNASAGDVSQTGGVITAATLGVRASGSISLTSALNDVDTFVANAGTTLAFADTDGVTIGTVTASPSGCFVLTTGISAGSVEFCLGGSLSITTPIGATNVRLATTSGSITQGGTGVITATNLGVRAPGSIDLNTLTNVVSGTFAAASTTLGVIEFLSSSGFTVGSIAGSGCFSATAGATTTDGNINIVAVGTLTIGDAGSPTNAVSAGGTGTILLDANGTNSDIALTRGILSGSGDVTLTADRHVTATLAGDITSTSGNLAVTADADASTTGAITMSNGTVWNAGSGTIDLNASGDIALGCVRTTNNTGSAVSIDSIAGGVIDAGDTDREIIVDTGTVIVTAATGIGGTAGSGADAALETAIGTLDATVTTAGAIDINELSAIALADVDTFNGPIRVDAGNQITATDVQSANGAEANDIILTTAASGILVALVSAAGSGDVYLSAVTSIEESVADGAADILGQDLELVATTGIGNLAQLEINGVNLAAITTSGDVNLQDTALGLTITDVNVDPLTAITSGVRIATGAVGDDIIVRASSPLTVNSLALDNGGGNITLAAEGAMVGDDLTINANVTASGGSGSIFLYGGDSIILAATVTASAASTGMILASAGTNYNGGFPLNGNSAGDVTMADGSRFASQDGNIRAQAPNDVSLSLVDADSNGDNTRGNVTITADYAGPGGTLNDSSGAIIDNTAGEAQNIRGDLATLRAATGIGSGGGGADLETNIVTLDAVNSNSGDIVILELAAGTDLDVQTATQSGAAAGVDIALTTENGHLTLLGAGTGVRVLASATGTIQLSANAVTAASDEPARGDVVLNNVVTTQGAAITITGDHDVRGDTVGVITSNGGSVSITADANDSGPGSNNNGTIQLSGNISAGAGGVTFSLADCDGWVGASPAPSAVGNVTAATINMGSGTKTTAEGVLRLQGGANSTNGATTVVEGTLIINGVLTAGGGVAIQSGGVLGGTGSGAPPSTSPTWGRINGNVTVGSGGVLDPGDCNQTSCAPEPGVLGVNGNVDIVAGGTLRVQLNGLVPSTEYDQLVLIGEGNLHGAVADGSGGATLTVQPGWPIPVGAEFYIVSKIPGTDWDTRFLGLPEGDFFFAGSTLMNISYRGRDAARSSAANNDIVLTAPGRYDFNGYNGYTADNYMPVSPFTGYGGGNSAGWLTLPERYFERNYPVEPPYTTSEERLIYDGHSTNRSGDPISFRLDVVAAKTYEVMILTGDVAWNHDRELFTATASTGGSVQMQVDTWGAGAPDGSGVNVTWGGGTANPEGTGYYRWIRLTLQVGGAAYTTEQITITMDDLGGWDSTAVILGMDIRPTNTVGLIALERTLSLNSSADATSPFDPLPADGVTVDTYQGTGAPPNATITITVSAGTPTAQYTVVTTDEDPTTFGTQVTANAAGTFTFSVQRPATLTNTPATSENWTILAEESSGLSRGTAIQEYVAPNAQALRFDFGIYGSPVQTYVANTVTKSFLEVIPQMVYNSTRGYGWSTRVAGAWRKDPAMSNLRTDLNYARDATFRVDLPSSGTYNVRVYHSNPLYYGTVSYIADYFEVYAEGALMYTVDTIDPGTTWPLASSTFTVSVTDGTLDLRFRDIGGQDINFVVSGIDISAGALPTDTPLLASGDPQDDGAPAISADVLRTVAGEAAAAWSARELTPTQAATLADARFTVSDLGGALLGLANPAANTIRIDDDAAMIGWSVVSGQSSVASGRWSLVSGMPGTSDQGRMTNDGVDLLTVVMHELGHLLGYDHSANEHDLMAPVLESGVSRSLSLPASSAPGLSLGLSPNLPRLAAIGSSIEWQARLFDAEDSVYAELGRDSGEDEADGDVSASLLESVDDGLLAAQIAKAGEQPGQARVPRRSRLERFERELDAWFAELAATESVGG